MSVREEAIFGVFLVWRLKGFRLRDDLGNFGLRWGKLFYRDLGFGRTVCVSG